MKNILLLMLSYVSIAYAQQPNNQVSEENCQNPAENRLLIEKDFKMADGRMVVTEIWCAVANGNTTDKFLVSVVCLKNAFAELGIEKINEIILLANKKAQATLDFEHSYLPTEIKMAYNPMIRDWCLTSAFSAKDKDGNVNAKLVSMDFDSTGKFKVMKCIF